MSYIIKKNGRRYNTKSFDSYEQARSYVRKKLRTSPERIKGGDIGDAFHNNPSHSTYGFSINKV